MIFLLKSSYVYTLDIEGAIYSNYSKEKSMLTDILNSLKITASNDDRDSRRSSERRKMDSCVGIIDGKAYPIQDWSDGGVLLHGDDRTFTMNEVKTITMKFKLENRIMDVTHTGRVLRKARDKFVLQFSPLTQDVNKKFKQVIDDYVTQEFTNSQQV